MRIHRLVVLIAIMISAGCHIGANAARMPVATSVQGAMLQLYTNTGKTEGELIAVRDDGVIVLLHDGRVALVPWTTTTMVTAKGMGIRYQYGSRIAPSSEVKTNLTLVSHYPQGMTPEIQARFLASKAQAQLITLQ